MGLIINGEPRGRQQARDARQTATAGKPWETELLVLRAQDRNALLRRVRALQGYLEDHPDMVLKDLAFTLTTETGSDGSRLALVAGSTADLRGRLARAAERLADPGCRHIKDSLGVYYFDQPLYPEGRVALLFPGEGAQYLNMLGGLLPHFPEVRACFEECDRTAAQMGQDQTLSDVLFLPEGATAEERARAEKELRRLGTAMFSVLMADWALYQLLLALGLRPDAVAGHSMGELAALWASGCLTFDDLLLGQVVNTLETLQQQEDEGDAADAVLLAVGAGHTLVAEVIAGAGGGAYLAMDNCPHQTVVVGRPGPMAAIEAEFQARRVVCERLPFRRPYHTELFEPLLGPLDRLFDQATFRPARTPVYSCTTGGLFPSDPAEIRRLVVSHWARPVEFVRMIETMYADGVRLFVEAGPRGNLSAFVEDILRGRAFAALPADVPRRPGLTQLNHMAGLLAAHHVPLQLEHFYNRRDPQRLDWEGAASPPHPRPLSPEAGARGERKTPEAEEKGAAGFMPAVRTAGTSPAAHSPASAVPGSDFEGGGVGSAGPGREAVLTRYLGVMEQFLDVQRAVTEQFLTRCRTGPVAAPAPARRARPLIGEVVRLMPGRELVMRRRLDLAEDLFAGDHTVGGRTVSKVAPDQYGLPVMPMTFSAEMMAETAALLVPGQVVIGLKGIRLFRWLPFDQEEPTAVEVTARVLSAEEGTRQVAVEVRDLGSSSRPGDSRWVAVQGTVVLADSYPEPPAVPAFPLSNERPCRISLEVLYKNLFHGPLFQGVCSTDRVGDEGIESVVRVLPRSGLFRSAPEPDLMLDPVLIDVAMHPLASWHLEQPDQSGRLLLPVEVGAVQLFGPPPPVGALCRSLGRTEETSARHFAHGVDVVGPDGRLWCRLVGARYWRFYVPFGEVNFHGPKDEYFLSKAWPLDLPRTEVEEQQGRPDSRLRPGRPLACCMRLNPPTDLRQPAMRLVTARVTLSLAELRQFRHLRGTEQELNDWLFGRIAAKDAVRTLWWEHRGERLFPADIEIDTAPDGRLAARRRGRSEDHELPAVAVAHADGLVAGLAAFVPHVGIALRRLKSQDAELDGDAHLRCAKEAVARALGRDLADGAAGLVVHAADRSTGVVRVALEGELAEAFPELASSWLIVRTARENDLVVATTLCERAPA